MRADRRAGREGVALARVLRRSRVAMGTESFLRAFWPLGSALLAIWAAFAFGLAEILTRGRVLALTSVLAVGVVFLLALGVRRFRWPTADAARARLDATLPGRPLAALRDAPALNRDDPGAQSVWAAHLARMRRIAATARPVVADLRLARFDPWAIRLVALVAALAALAFAPDRRVESVAAALGPAGGPAVAAGPSFEGWAEPPAYTGRPTLYLPEVDASAPVPVPQGTKITLRTYGDAEGFSLAESVSGAPEPAALAAAAPGIAAAEFPVAASGAVTLRQHGRTLGAWNFVMEPDAAPTIAMTGTLERAPTGETRLGYEAHDDHGVTAARAAIALDLARVDRSYGLATPPEPRAPLAADLPLPMAGNAGDVAETLVEDFSKSPLAGLPVTVTLTAEDATGQAGTAAPVAATLPMRSFYDPLAAALIEQRRDLLWSSANGHRVVQVLRAVTNHPDDVFESPRAYLVVRTALRRLAAADAAGSVAGVRDEVAEALWQAAVEIEDGALGDAAARLAKAQERLQQALENGAPDDEIARLMDELRKATQDYMQQMAKDAIERGQNQAQLPPGQTVTQDQIQELMDKIQELSEQGRKAEAQQLLEMLQQMLKNMQMAMGQGQGGQGENGQGQQSMQGLADALREQQGLADDSFQELQRRFREARPGQGQPGQGQPGQGRLGEGQPGQDQPGEARPGQGQPRAGGPDGRDQQSLAERQEALRQLLEEMQKSLPGEAGEAAREALRDAERSMGAARDGLAQGDMPEALDKQGEAIDNLREGMKAMGDDLRRADRTDGEGDQGQSAGDATADNGRDPLGRPIGSRGGIGTGETMVPEADSAGRARALLDEIRRRSGDLARPEIELDYLRRLLDLF